MEKALNSSLDFSCFFFSKILQLLFLLSLYKEKKMKSKMEILK